MLRSGSEAVRQWYAVVRSGEQCGAVVSSGESKRVGAHRWREKVHCRAGAHTPLNAFRLADATRPKEGCW